MVLKDWKKVEVKKDFLQFGKGTSKIHKLKGGKTFTLYKRNVYVVQITNPSFKKDPQFLTWFVDIFNNGKLIKNDKRFKTKTKALAFAKAYMRKH